MTLRLHRTKPVVRRQPWSWRPPFRAVLAALVVLGGARAATAGSLTQKDVQILGRALGFLSPAAPADGVVAIAYAAGDPASKAAADEIAGYLGDGLTAGGQTLKPKVVDAAALGSGGGYSAIIAAQGAAGDAVMAAAKGHKIVCATGDVDAVKAGKCIIAVQSAPKVEIDVNHDAATAAGIGFDAAFRMMIHEF